MPSPDTGQIEVVCPRCEASFFVAKSLRGGRANCPRCRQAAEVPGGPEPLFWALLLLGAVVVLCASAALYAAAGAVAAFACFAVGAAILGTIVLAC